MADFSKLYRIVSGKMTPVDLSVNSLVVGSLKVGSTSPVELTQAILTNLESLVAGGYADAGALHSHDGRYNQKTDLAATSGGGLIGYNGVGRVFVASDTTVQTAIDSLDSALNTTTTEVGHLVSLSGVAANSVDFGTFTGVTIANNSTNKTALQALETAVELRALDSVVVKSVNSITPTSGAVVLTTANIAENTNLYYTDARAQAANAASFTAVNSHINNLVTLSGVAIDSVNLGTFTGTVLAVGNETIKAAIQTLGTAHDTLASAYAAHAANSTIHYTQAAISITSSQVSDFQAAARGEISADNTGGGAVTVSYSSSTGKISAAINPSSITNTMLAGSIADNKLASSFVKVDGSVAMTGELILAADPTHSLGAVTKQYADGIASGIIFRLAVMAATVAPLPTVVAAGSKVGKTLTASASGVLVIDGYTPVLNDRLLIKNQVNTVDNGIYTLSTVGTVSVPFVLTRATDSDGSPTYEVAAGDTVYVEDGSINAGAQWSLVGNGIIDVDGAGGFQVWTLIQSPVSVQAGAGLSHVNTTFNVNVDGSTVVINGGNAIQVNDSGITQSKLATASVGTSQLIDLNVTTGKLALLAVGTAQLAAGSVTKAKMDASVAGDGIKQNADGRLDLDIVSSSGLSLSASDGSGQLDVALGATNPGLVKASGLAIDWAAASTDQKAWKASSLAATSGAAQIGYDHTVSGLVSTNVKAAIDEVKGMVTALTTSATLEVFADSSVVGIGASGVFAVRFGIVANGETAGKLYKADKAQGGGSVTDLFWSVGVLNYTLGAGGTLCKIGNMTATGHGLSVGQPFFLSTAGALTSTAPSTEGDATVVMGIVRDANTLEVGIHHIGIFTAM